jgi:eukaryotic-like serine/threonine-protein kinase
VSDATIDTRIGHRYLLQEYLGGGGMGMVYRALDRLSGQAVALKRVTTQPTNLEFASRGSIQNAHLALANEFQTLASLRHPHIISVLDYGFDNLNQPYFTMELLEQGVPITRFVQDKTLNDKVRLLSEMLQALAYLHRRGILHRDLKPDNAVVQQHGPVRLLDFGLAMLQSHEASEEVVGTLTYIAPEVLRGAAVTPAADLYALGVIAYEMFSGCYPFALDNPTQLMNDILAHPPDMTQLDIPEALVHLVERLLYKTPQQRPQSAESVLRALLAMPQITVPIESVAVRESFLQAAKFVGRNDEIATLENALNAAVQGKGSAWLVGGESGVGKSRLLDELRSRALVQGILVLRGQSVSDVGLPYRPWRDVVKRLVLSSELTHLEASILKEIVPDIGMLMQQSIPDAPDIPRTAAQQRLIHTITALFRRHSSPILLLLEDLHWAEESLEPLRQLTRIIGELPLLVIGTYRDEERPALPDDLPDMTIMKLPRLTEAGIHELSYSMLGDTGRQPDVLELLIRETEGNVFFVVEVVRTLAEEAGNLNMIGQKTLPMRVFADGVKSVVSRRLQRVPEWCYPVLELAAVAGRYIDLPVMHILIQQMNLSISLDQWLSACANCAVIELSEERWQFTHDKLRDSVLDKILPDMRPNLHNAVANAIEQVFAASQDLPTHYSNLAYHYGKSGNTEQERHYARLAGERAAARFASKEASQLLTRAIELTPDSDIRARYEILLVREQLAGNLGWNEIQVSDLQTLNALAEQLDPHARATVAMRQAAFAAATGDYQQGIVQAQRAIELAQQLRNKAMLGEGYLRLGQCVARLGQFIEANRYLKKALKLSEKNSAPSIIGNTLLTLGNIAIDLGSYVQAQSYYEQSLLISRQIGDFNAASRGINNLGEVARYQGDYEAAGNYFLQALQSFQEVGNRRGMGMTLGNLGLVAIARGDYATAQHYYEQAEIYTKEAGDRYNESWILLGFGLWHRQQGNFAQSQQYFDQSLALSRAIGQQDVEGWCLAEMALLYHASGDYSRAVETSEAAVQIARHIKSPPLEAAALLGLGHGLAAQHESQRARRAYSAILKIEKRMGGHAISPAAEAGLNQLPRSRKAR